MATAYVELVKRRNLQFQMTDAVTLLETLAARNENANTLRFNAENPALFDWAIVGAWSLSTAQAGNGASTNVLDTGQQGIPGGAAFRVTAAIGATPTCTYLLEGSKDNITFVPVTYSDSLTPATFVTTTFVMTTAVTKILYVKPSQPFRFLRVTYSANTNVTNTTDIALF